MTQIIVKLIPTIGLKPIGNPISHKACLCASFLLLSDGLSLCHNNYIYNTYLVRITQYNSRVSFTQFSTAVIDAPQPYHNSP